MEKEEEIKNNDSQLHAEWLASLSADIQKDVNEAVAILKEGGCSEIFVFGSLTAPQESMPNDIDLAIRGCPQGEFFRLMGRLMMSLSYPVDMINLDSADPFARFLEKEGNLKKIA